MRAQSGMNYASVDSTSYAMYASGNWKALSKYGKKSISDGMDFPYLRQRMGYANYMRGNFSSAEKNYRVALKSDSYNQSALYFIALSNENLNRGAIANYYGKKMNDSLATVLGLKKHALINSFDMEGGGKFPANDLRQNAGIFRIGIGSQLSWRWSLYQSVTVFGQNVYDNQLDNTHPHPWIHIGQRSYYGRLNFQAFSHLGFWMAYEGISIKSQTNDPPQQQNQNGPPMGPRPVIVISEFNSIFLGGFNYSFSHLNLQGEFANAFSKSGNFSQATFSFMYMPFGNLNFYLRSSSYFQFSNSTMNFVESPFVGIHPFKKVWMETGISIGKFNDLLEGQGLYFQNMYDDTKFRSSTTVFIPINKKIIFNLNFTDDLKQMSVDQSTYYQPSLTLGLLWKL
jgi:hypothetical protein